MYKHKQEKTRKNRGTHIKNITHTQEGGAAHTSSGAGRAGVIVQYYSCLDRVLATPRGCGGVLVQYCSCLGRVRTTTQAFSVRTP